MMHPTALLVLAFLFQDPSDKWTPSALLTEGLRLETEKQNYARAIEFYKKAYEKAKDALKDIAARAKFYEARCQERMDNLTAAQQAYQELTSNLSDQKPYADLAAQKLQRKGIDVIVDRFWSEAKRWRDATPNNAPELAKVKETFFESRIKPLGPEATPGLIEVLGHEDDLVRDFAAESLALVADGPSLNFLTEKLSDANPRLRAGASLAMGKILERLQEAAKLDRQAAALEADMSRSGDLPNAQQLIRSSQDLARKLRDKSTEIRGHLTGTNTSSVQTPLQGVIADAGTPSWVRVKAAEAAACMGNLSTGLLDTLLQAFDSKDRDIRAACAAALGFMDTTAPAADRRRATDRLTQAVSYEPEKDEATPQDQRDGANDASVRRAAAIALGQIGMVRAIPSLIKALDDTSSDVRRSANEALVIVTGKDLGFEPDPYLPDPDYADKGKRSGERALLEKETSARRESIARWRQWWEGNQGIEVIVLRFWRFTESWKKFKVEDLFDRDIFLARIKARAWSLENPDREIQGAEAVLQEFEREKGVFQQEILDLGSSTAPYLMKFLGGEREGTSQPNVAVSRFVAETLALLGDATVLDELKNALASASSPMQRAGAAFALGKLSSGRVTPDIVDVLENRGLADSDPRVKEFSATALGKTGKESSAGALLRVVTDPEEKVRVAAVRSIGQLKVGSPETVKTLGEMIGDEPEAALSSKKDASALVREYACSTLATIGDVEAIPSLLRARRDLQRNVREAASSAIAQIGQKNAALAMERVRSFLSLPAKAYDRLGAALALGDLGDPMAAKLLVFRILSENPPKVLRDPDPAVRASAAHALGRLFLGKPREVFRRVLDALIEGLNDEAEEVRAGGYEALISILGSDTVQTIKPDFHPSLKKDARDQSVQAWRQWFETNKANFREDPI